MNPTTPSLFPKLLPDVLERFRARRRKTRVVSIGQVKLKGFATTEEAFSLEP